MHSKITTSSFTEAANGLVWLVISDVEACLEIEAQLRSGGFSNIEVYHQADDCQKVFETGQTPDLIIASASLLSIENLSLIKYIRETDRGANFPILVATNPQEIFIQRKALNIGVTALLALPLDSAIVVTQAYNLVRAYRLNTELEAFKSRVSSELKVAQRLQQSLLPSERSIDKCKQTTGLDISFALHSSSELSGDFWGVKDVHDGMLTIFIADLVGHGIAAAANTFRLHEIITSEELIGSDLLDFVARVNSRFHQNTPADVFAALMVGQFDLALGTFKYVSAMATSPIFWRSGASLPLMLDTAGVPLGATDDPRYEAHSIPFYPGDRLFFYSDALIEAPSKKGGMLGSLMPCEIVTKAILQEARSVIGSVEELFCQEAKNPLHDDLTLLFISSHPEGIPTSAE
ncbi:MAG: hypothetical protein COB37_01740 [Kordiimonadales bacterium]|nr:MAG: hypothetical protein COB37_01740 [Kordiimonadales bacterium]